MGGSLIRNEPTTHTIILQDQICEPKFRQYCWMDYFLKLNGFDNDIALEFSQTFSNGEAMVKGLKVNAIEEHIAEVSRLPMEGEKYPESEYARFAREKFSRPRDPPLNVDKRETRRLSLPENGNKQQCT